MSDPWIPDAVCETHEWRSPLGETIRFTTRLGAAQRMMPPVSVSTIQVPGSHGARFGGAGHAERLVALPVIVPNSQSGRAELRRWAKALDPAQGEGTLTVVQGDSAGRQLVCVYETGLDELTEEFLDFHLTTLAFHAAQPYWQDAIESETVADINDTGYTWFPFAGSWAAHPLILGESDVFAALTITNSGDVDAWPTIIATGPGEELHLTNQTTGADLQLTGTVAAGSLVVIDTRPGHKTVTVDGYNAFSRLTPTSSLWPLVPGPNRVSIGFATATVASLVRFRWRRHWLAA